MNIQEELIKLKDRYEKNIVTLNECTDFEKEVSFVADTSIFFEPKSTWDDCKKLLSSIAKTKGKYQLEAYYMNYTDLAIRYQFTNFQAILFCKEVDVALKSLGNGKCKVVDRVTTEKSIICDI
jgi:hypothetical protein